MNGVPMKFDYSKTINEQLSTFNYYKDRYCSYELELLKDRKEIKRLNNIINEFDKWLENEIKFQEIVENAHFLRKARIKLQELKGSDNNER